ncbi:MAG: ABC-type phosphate/phosphonate transport system substrate-binding protein [Paracoccaceae bacterium]
MIAMLGMYDIPALQDANDRFWQLIREHLGHGPARLSRDRDYWEMWQSPDLLLGQTCSLPYRTRLHGTVGLIGTPDYGLPDCPPGFYQSVFVVNADADGETLADFSDGTFAYNESASQSGWSGPTTHLRAANIHFDSLLETGAHVISAQAVAEGRADIAGLDALTWSLIQEHGSVANRLRVITKTTPTPGLPYITAKSRDVAALTRAVRSAIDALTPQDRDLLHLKGLVSIDPASYLAIPNPPAPKQKTLFSQG